MKLKVSQLDTGENRFQFSSAKDKWLKGVIDHLGTQGYTVSPTGLDMDLVVTKLEPDYVLRGRLGYEATMACDRCAEPFSLKVKHPFDLAYVRSAQSEGDEDLDQTVFEGDEIDLKPLVEEQFFLGLPFALICKEDCKGICQSCGENRNLGNCHCVASEPTNAFSELAKLRDSGR